MKYLVLLLLSTVLGCSSASKSELASKEQVDPAKATSQVTVSSERKEFENQSKKNLFTCTKTSDSRNIEIEKAEPKGCELYYSSYGNRKKVASSVNGNSHCEQVKQKIQSNLEQAGFKCAEPTRATATEAKK